MTEKQVWIVTGASSGFGLAIAATALERGFKVIATARDPTKARESHPHIESRGGRWIKLDVRCSLASQHIRDVIEEEGRIDVLVNNAGHGLLGSIEDMRHVHDTALYGGMLTRTSDEEIDQ